MRRLRGQDDWLSWRKRSPDGAKRNPGPISRYDLLIPDCASLHPGYEAALTLPLGAHEIEIAAFVGLQNRFVEQMSVAAARPFRRRRRRQHGAAFLQLR